MTSESPQVRAPALEMRGITKRYPGVVANDSIDLDIRPGEIHALLGENGAGKTTLMNILYGLARPDAGQILIDGSEVTLSGPSDAIRRGISMVHQHFMLVPVLTVAENIVLGEEIDHPRRVPRPEGGAQADHRARTPVRVRGRPGGEGRIPVGRLAAAGRDPEGPLPRRQGPRPRRTDGGPDAPGDRRRSSRSCGAWRPKGTASSSSATSCTRSSRSRTGSRSSGAARSSASGSRPRPTRKTSPSSWSAARCR